MQRAKRTYSSGTSGVTRPTEPLAWRPRRVRVTGAKNMGETRKNGCVFLGKSKNWLVYDDWYLFPSWMICHYKGRKLFGSCFSSSLKSVVHLGLWVRVFHAMQHLGVGTFGWNLLLCILRATFWTCNLPVCMVFTCIYKLLLGFGWSVFVSCGSWVPWVVVCCYWGQRLEAGRCFSI